MGLVSHEIHLYVALQIYYYMYLRFFHTVTVLNRVPFEALSSILFELEAADEVYYVALSGWVFRTKCQRFGSPSVHLLYKLK